MIVAIASEAASEAGKNWELMEADERSEFMKLAFSKYKLLGVSQEVLEQKAFFGFNTHKYIPRVCVCVCSKCYA